MKATELYNHLHSLGVRLDIDRDELICRARPGILTPELRESVAANKSELLELVAHHERDDSTSPRSRPDTASGSSEPYQVQHGSTNGLLDSVDDAFVVSPQTDDVRRKEYSKGSDYPLSFSQERLWFVEQLDPNPALYLIFKAIRMQGALDRQALERSLNEILRRHEVLRTRYPVIDGRPVQVVDSEFSLELETIRTDCVDKEEEERRVDRIVGDLTSQGIDIINGPVFRACLIELGAEEYVLVLIWHHIAFDGYSVGIFLNELTSLYTAFTKGAESPLDELPGQYKDIAIWQRKYLSTEKFSNQLDYWRKQLQDLPAFELPSDYERPPVRTSRGGRKTIQLSASTVSGLANLTRDYGATLFMTLFAAFQVLLHRHSRLDEIVVGSPVAGRTRMEAEALIGCFINSLVFRTDLSGNPQFSALLDHVREVTFAAFAAQDVPFEMLLDEFRPDRDASRTPLFQVFFNMMYSDDSQTEFENLKITDYPIRSVEAKFDLTLYVLAGEKDIRMNAVYNRDIFSEERMSQLFAQYKSLLEQIVSNPKKRIQEYSLVTEEAKKSLPDPTLSLGDAWCKPVHDHVSKRAVEQPEKIAVFDSRCSWTYDELDKRANRLSNWLTGQGIAKEDIVAVYASRSVSLVCSLLGILKTGASFLILDPAYPGSRLAQYVELSSPKAIIGLESAGVLPAELQIDGSGDETISVITVPDIKDPQWAEFLQEFGETIPEVEIGPDDVAYIAYTSGSTGVPKGVQGRHGSLTHFQSWMRATFGLDAADRVSLLSGLAHDPLHRDMFCTLIRGGTVCVPDQDIIVSDRLANWFLTEAVTVAHLTPAMARVLAAAPKGTTIPSLKCIFLVGDECTPDTVRALAGLCPEARIVNLYGTTETQRAVGYHVVTPQSEELDSDANHPDVFRIPIGVGIQDVQLLILNDSGIPAGVNEIGEIFVRSHHLAKGYLNDPSLTATRFIVNPFTMNKTDILYRTGDLGYYDRAGRAFYYGRSDGQVTIRGFRIETGEVEKALRSHSAVKFVVVTGKNDSENQKRLVAYVILEKDQNLTMTGVRTYLSERLPNYMIPTALVPLRELPLTPNGKIAYDRLPTPDHNRHVSENTFVEPRTEQEKLLAGIWEEVLNLNPIGVTDNFFDLGGHSILAVELLSKVKAAFSNELSLAAFFQDPTITGQIESMCDRLENQPWKYLVLLQDGGERTPLFCVHSYWSTIKFYLPFARFFVGERPVYGVQGEGLDGGKISFRSVEAMATAYVEEIMALQPQGPYNLLGFCFGSRLALEVARQIRFAGEDVSFIGFVDGLCPNVHKKRRSARDIFEKHVRLIRSVGISHIVQTSKNQLKLRTERFRSRFYHMLAGVFFKAGISLPKQVRFEYVMRTNTKIFLAYSIKPFDGKLAVFRSTAWEKYPEDLGWQNYFSRGVESNTFQGHHADWESSHISSLAQEVIASIRRSEVADEKK